MIYLMYNNTMYFPHKNSEITYASVLHEPF